MGSDRRRTEMASKKHRPGEALAKLRQVDVLVSQGQSVAEAIRAIRDRGDVLPVWTAPLAQASFGLGCLGLYGLLPLRKRPSGWAALASLRTCIRRLGSDPS